MKYFSIILLTLMLISCNSNEPTRIKGIPKEAFWKGGKCGGQWYLIEKINEKEKTINCKIYNDRFGHLIINDQFILSCDDSNRKIDLNTLKQDITSTDWGVNKDNSDISIHLKKRFDGDSYCVFKIKNKHP